jgi:hypothetical protein
VIQVRDWIVADPDISQVEIQHRFQTMGIPLNLGQVELYRRGAKNLLFREAVYGEIDAQLMFPRRGRAASART